MLNTRARTALVGVAVFVAALLGAAESARAAIYRGSWDPKYGEPFPDLGWKGTATFYVPDACLLGSGWVSNDDTCSNDGMKVLSASVSLYDWHTSTVAEILNFNPSVPVFQMYIDAGQLAGVSTDFLGPKRATSSIAGSGANYFDLQFLESTTNNVQLFHTPGSKNPGCAYVGSPNYSAACGYSANAPTMTLTLVPEPATFALVLAGLGAIGFTTRRRRG